MEKKTDYLERVHLPNGVVIMDNVAFNEVIVIEAFTILDITWYSSALIAPSLIPSKHFLGNGSAM